MLARVPEGRPMMKPAAQMLYFARLLEMKSRLASSVEFAESALRDDVLPPGENGAIKSHPADAAVEGMDKEVVVAQNQEHLLEEVDAAIARIEQRSFGKCVDCGHAIPKQRLDAIPYTRWCAACAENHDVELRPPSRG